MSQNKLLRTIGHAIGYIIVVALVAGACALAVEALRFLVRAILG